MSLPMSPPPSRSSSQTSVSRKPTTYDPSTRIIAPISPAASPSTSPSTKKAKPTLTLNPSAAPALSKTTFFNSPTQTPSTAASSTASSALRSFFSPCSDSEDEDDSDNDDGITPIRSAKPRGHFHRLWASRDPPSMPPSDPPPAIPRRLSIVPSPTFGWKTSSSTNSSPAKDQFLFSPGPNTPPQFSPRRPSRLSTFSMYPPAAPEAPPTGVYPPPSPWSDRILSYTNSPTIMTPSDPLLQNLQNLLSAQLQSLSSIFTAPPPAELVIARAERDRLMVKTQKAYFRRTPAEALEEMHIELKEMEERVKVLEKNFVKGFLGAMDEFSEGVRAGCMGFMGESEPEIIEIQVPEPEQQEEEEEEVFTSAMEWPEEEVGSTASRGVECNASTNPERRFTWTPSSFDDSDEEEEQEEEGGDYYADEDEDSHQQLPPLSPDEELYQSEYTASASSSSCGSSPIIGGRGRLPGAFTREACGCQGECDCWNSFLPPSPAMSSTSQRMISCVGPKGGKKNNSEVIDLNLDWEGMEWSENVVVVQQVGGVEMMMI